MSETEKLRSAIAHFEASVQKSWSLADANFDENRREVLVVRRLIVEQIGNIGRLGETALRPTGHRDAFRRRFSEMRLVIALHQADWPVVAIKLDDPGYIASADTVRRTTQSFIMWVKSVLVPS